MRSKFMIILLTVLSLTGCPKEDNQAHCEKSMVCEDDQEMFCEKVDMGCGENCYYFTYENCYEACKDESR